MCDPFAPTANRTAIPTPDLRPRRAIHAPWPKLVRPQRRRILCSLVRQHERASGAAAWGSLGAPAGVAGATKNKLRRRRMDVISPPRFFSPLFSSRGQGCPRRAGVCRRHSERRADGKSISMIAASLSSCYAGRGGKTKTEGLQYLEPMGNVLLGSPGELLTLPRHRRVRYKQKGRSRDTMARQCRIAMCSFADWGLQYSASSFAPALRNHPLTLSSKTGS